MLADVGVAAPDEVVEWFTWHNGVVPGHHKVSFGPCCYRPFSLTEAIAARQTRIDLASGLASAVEGVGSEHWWWEPTWLPLGEQADTSFVVDVGSSGPNVTVRAVCWEDQAGPSAIRREEQDSSEGDPYLGGFRRVISPSLSERVGVWIRLLDTYCSWSTQFHAWDYDFERVAFDDRAQFA